MGAHYTKKEDFLQILHTDYHDHLIPIEGYEKMPLVSLELAVEPLMSFLPVIQTYVQLAKQKCQKPADGLTRDQSASIMLCTMRWQPFDQCLSIVLNETLCSTDREKLKPWFLYLKLLITALSRLPSVHRIVYRGIKLDVSQQYPKDKTIVWWDFSLCTTSVGILHSEKHFGKKDIRTIFSIECNSSKDISKHAFNSSRETILLLAATQFQVMQCVKQEPNLNWIQLKEIQSPFALLEPVPIVSQSSRDLIYVDSTPFQISSSGPKQSSTSNEHNSNRKLERLITKSPSNSSIHLRIEPITNRDMKLIVQQALNNKKCTELWLYNAQITSQGALILSNGLFNNKTLKKLYLNDNCIHDRGAYSLARVLAINNTTLKDLYLARNGITSRGVQYLSDMLNTNTTLTTLSLYGNQIDDNGIKYLTHILTFYNTTLEYLYLSGNDFMTDLSIDYFIDMFKHNRSLKKLHLFNCNLSDSGKTKLRKIVKTKKYFKLYI